LSNSKHFAIIAMRKAMKDDRECLQRVLPTYYEAS